MRLSLGKRGFQYSFGVSCTLLCNLAHAEDEVKEKRELADGKVSYVHMERQTPRPMHIHLLKMDLTNSGIEWKVVVAKDPDGD
ncbi:MAG: hypothetical protein ACK5T6_16195, partial [Pirellula sp.]